MFIELNKFIPPTETFISSKNHKYFHIIFVVLLTNKQPDKLFGTRCALFMSKIEIVSVRRFRLFSIKIQIAHGQNDDSRRIL